MPHVFNCPHAVQPSLLHQIVIRIYFADSFNHLTPIFEQLTFCIDWLHRLIKSPTDSRGPVSNKVVSHSGGTGFKFLGRETAHSAVPLGLSSPSPQKTVHNLK